jgi:Rad3-related DNA helicase
VATIFFSATLLPVNYYKEMLSGDAGCDAIYIPSPFDRKNRAILVGRDVTTRYSRRGDNEYYRIYEYIKAMVYAKQGNYMVFFPSYKMMNDVYDIAVGDGLCNDRALIIQNSGMNEEEREKFLKHFSESDRVVAFCIMGGIFSEGIDLDGDKLVGAAVVGPGLPQVCTERQLRMDFFDKRQGNGFKYAYVYPGINKVLQAAGRVIRTEEDKGVIMLLDERFAKAEYKVLYPEEWSDYRLCNINQAAGILSDFWNLLKPM